MMKKQLLLSLLTAFSLSAAKPEIPDLTGCRETASAVCFSENFNSDTSCWKKSVNKDGRGLELFPNEGPIGSPAIGGEMPEGYEKNYPSWHVPVKIRPGKPHKVTFQYRLVEVRPKKKQRHRWCLASLRMKDQQGKKKNFNFWVPAQKMAGYENFEEIVNVPAEVLSEAEFIVHFDWWHTGKFLIDEIAVATLDTAVELQLQKPDRLQFDDRGTILLRPQMRGAAIPETWECLVEVNGQKILAKREPSGNFTLALGSLAPGEYPMTAILFDRAGKTIFTRLTHRLQRREGTLPVTFLDEHGRMICNGEPILPIGYFTMMPMKDEDFQRLADAGCNFVQIQPMHGRGPAPAPGCNTSDRTLAQLEYLKKFGLKGLMFMQLMIPEKAAFRTKLEKRYNDATELPEIVREIASTLKGNPNVIGYYLADENGRRDMPSTRELRERVAAADPTHLTATLTNSAEFLDSYCSTGDILLFDCYPFNSMHAPGIKGDLLFADDALRKIAALKTPFWLTPQGYDWSRNPNRSMFGKTNEEKRRHLSPTEEELTALPLLGAIYGAKGFFYYSYHEIFKHGETVQPGFGEFFWPRVTAGTLLLKELSPWLLSLEKAPELKLAVTCGGVRGRIFSHGGKLVVLLVGLHDAPNAAGFTLPEGKEFSSMTGRSRKENGKWNFSVPGVSYDVIREK